ncbi:LacI family DNA-binding transcriptional regulator [Microbacterium sp. MPKO10]|uniref:LacI family DNA-binding transcriptional regulator n=1 Tax=Microbacterium sp. MPKO10 TaxID=2989818 RepID=UPI002235626B|nr:LacI family DNA-binding transcriptional regulator [Microbacterium sp. MPKO10]MCW4459135.1 LacI family transcriptional regulator [Microbacterium sp. MPKO10]
MAVTIRDVAKEAGVSISTVSRALSSPNKVADATREAVESVVVRLGYRPNKNARGLITGRSGTIGLIIPDLENPYFGAVSKGVQERARAAGYSVYIGDFDEDPSIESTVVRSLAKQVDGIIMCSPRSTDVELGRLTSLVPTVLANRKFADVPSIVFDNGGMLRVLRHLTALGHTTIAYAGGPEQSWSHRHRSEAFQEFGEAHGTTELIELGSFPPNFGGGVQAADLALASGATAVVAYNDLIALGLLDRLRERGVSVPEQISIVGFDNVAVSTFVRPNLTTIDQPRKHMGRMAADLLLSILDADDAESTHIPRQLPVDLVVRQSTGEAPLSRRATGTTTAS